MSEVRSGRGPALSWLDAQIGRRVWRSAHDLCRSRLSQVCGLAEGDGWQKAGRAVRTGERAVQQHAIDHGVRSDCHNAHRLGPPDPARVANLGLAIRDSFDFPAAAVNLVQLPNDVAAPPLPLRRSTVQIHGLAWPQLLPPLFHLRQVAASARLTESEALEYH